MIRRFTIKGFKRFERETVIELDPVTVLVGVNNSGKSTILDALTLFQYCVETTRRANGNGPGNGGNGRIDLVRRAVNPGEFGVLPVAEPPDLWPNGRTFVGEQQRAIELRAEYDNGAQVAFTLRLNYNRFRLNPRVSGDVTEAVRDRDIRLIPMFSGFLPREEYLTFPARRERLRLQEQLMAIMVRLARDEQGQFILATHSPQLLSAAPRERSGSAGTEPSSRRDQALPCRRRPDILW